MLFVVTDMPSIEGLITSADLHGDKRMRIVHEHNVHFDDLCVADLMTSLDSLEAIDYERVKTASVRGSSPRFSGWAATTCSWSRTPQGRRRGG